MNPPFFGSSRGPDSSRHWPQSASQSPENPLQEGRLPDTSGIELEYAAVQYSAKENRRFAQKQFLIAAAFGIQYFIYEHIFFFAFLWLHCLLAVLVVAFFLFAAANRFRSFWFKGIILLALPPLAAILFSFRNLPQHFIIAAICVLYLADQFAKHAFYLNTTVPVPVSTARNLRFLWSFRFLPLFNKPAGVDFYALGCFAVLVAFVPFIFPLSFFQSGVFIYWLPLCLLAIAVLFVVPFIIEPFAAFLTNRRYIGPVRSLRHFSRAVVSWFAYNRRMSHFPGTFRSPAGVSRSRCRMAIACIVLFYSALSPLFGAFQYVTITDILDRTSTSEAEPAEAAATVPPVEPTLYQRMKLIIEQREKPEPVEFEPLEPPLEPFGAVRKKETKVEEPEPELEPYQRAMLNRMTEQERKEYLDRIASTQSQQDLPPVLQDSSVSGRLLFVIEHEEMNSPRFRLAYFTIYATQFIPIGANFLFCLLIPPLFFLSCLFCVSARSIAYSGEQFAAGLPNQESDDLSVSGIIDRVRNSNDPREKEALFLGANAHDGTPVIVPRAVFQEHAHLLGDSGSGKTSLGMTSLIHQLIDFGDSSLVVIDLKADDLALFEATREKAKEIDEKLKREDPEDREAGYPFRWFTNELHHSTYVFNILQQSCFKTLTPYQRADMLTVAMGLQYGTDYGRAYYADANTELLHKALEIAPALSSFEDLAKILSKPSQLHVHRELMRAAAHLHAVINRLASCEAINASNPSEYHPAVLEDAIDLTQVFQKPQVLYYHLPSLIGTTSSAEIARFVVHMLLASSKYVGPKRKQVYLFIDEFQRITSQNLGLILQTARSMNVGVILANQTMSDLKGPGVDLIPTVEANTRYRQIFAASDLAALHQIVDSSGETIIHNRAWSEYLQAIGVFGPELSRTETEVVTPRLRANDVILASDHPLQSIVYVRRGKDYAQYGGFPFVMTSSHLVSPDVYDKRRKATWPDTIDATICPAHGKLPDEPAPNPPIFPGDGNDPVIGRAGDPQAPSPDETPVPADEPTPDAEETPPEADDPFYDNWKDVSERRKRQKHKKKRPQDKYRNRDSSSSDSEEDPAS